MTRSLFRFLALTPLIFLRGASTKELVTVKPTVECRHQRVNFFDRLDVGYDPNDWNFAHNEYHLLQAWLWHAAGHASVEAPCSCRKPQVTPNADGQPYIPMGSPTPLPFVVAQAYGTRNGIKGVVCSTYGFVLESDYSQPNAIDPPALTTAYITGWQDDFGNTLVCAVRIDSASPTGVATYRNVTC